MDLKEIRKGVRESKRKRIKRYETGFSLNLLIYVYPILVSECHNNFMFFPRVFGGITQVYLM